MPVMTPRSSTMTARIGTRRFWAGFALVLLGALLGMHALDSHAVAHHTGSLAAAGHVEATQTIASLHGTAVMDQPATSVAVVEQPGGAGGSDLLSDLTLTVCLGLLTAATVAMVRMRGGLLAVVPRSPAPVARRVGEQLRRPPSLVGLAIARC